MVVIRTICDQNGWDAIRACFVESENHFEELLELPAGVPGADTARRVIGAIDPEALREALIARASYLCGSTAGRLVAIDGKTVRGAFAGADGNGALHVSDAWVWENKMVLGHCATGVEWNEITAVSRAMSMGRREERQTQMWVAGTELARSPGHRFYEKLNELLLEANFDPRVEALSAGYFEADDKPVGRRPHRACTFGCRSWATLRASRRSGHWSGAALACARSLQTFPGLPVNDRLPIRSSLSRMRTRA